MGTKATTIDPRLGSKQVALLLNLHPVTLWRLGQREHDPLPPPTYFLGRKTWRQSEIEAWLARQPQDHRTPPVPPQRRKARPEKRRASRA